jgi:hypothetical protein
VTLAAIAAIIAALSAFDVGGFTGAGGRLEPAGIVHRGEFVMTKESTERIGVSNLYKLMRGQADLNEFFAGGMVHQRSFPGYADGGMVQPFSPTGFKQPDIHVVVLDSDERLKQYLESKKGQAVVWNHMQRRRTDLGISS